MEPNNDVSRIAERIVNHPTFVNRLTELTQHNSSSPSSRSNFASSREETQSLFFRGRRQSSSSSQIRSRSSTPKSATRKPKAGVTLKEVVLLDDPAQRYTIRGGEKKVSLVEKGFVFNQVVIPANYTEDQVLSYFEELFETPLKEIPNSPKISIKVGVGNILTKPALQPGKQLDAQMLKNICSQKTVWLLPTKSLVKYNEEAILPLDSILTCPNCGNQVYGDHDRYCGGGGSGSNVNPVDMDDIDNIDNKSELKEQKNLNTEENIAYMEQILVDVDREDIIRCLDMAFDLNDAVSYFLEKTDDPCDKEHPELSDVINYYKKKVFQADKASTRLTIERNNLWRDGIHFYKTVMSDLKKLFAPLRVKFVDEEGIDGGALTAEFFTKFLEEAKQQLFEAVDGREWHHVPKRSGGNLQIFKILGMAIGHSILNNGAFFKCLPPWAVDVLFDGTSGEVTIDDVPLTASTGCSIHFIRALNSCKTNNEIQDLFDSADGPGYEQVVGLSDWDQNVSIQLENKDILISMLLFEEMVIRRGKMINAIKEGLLLLKFDFKFHPRVARELFAGASTEVTEAVLTSMISWPCLPSSEQSKVITWFKDFIHESDTLTNLLKFCTGYNDATTLLVQQRMIELDFLNNEKLPKSSACSCILMIPMGNSTKEEFFSMMGIGIGYECEGFGDY